MLASIDLLSPFFLLFSACASVDGLYVCVCVSEVSVWSSHHDHLFYTQGPNMGGTSTATYINTNYTCSDWSSDL